MFRISEVAAIDGSVIRFFGFSRGDVTDSFQ